MAMRGAVEKAVQATPNAIGLVVIVTNDYSTTPAAVGLSPLAGTLQDGLSLQEAFSALRFAVCWVKNVARVQLQEIVSEIGRLRFPLVKNYRCILFIFAGHGCEGDYLWMQDGGQLQVCLDVVTPLLPKTAKAIGSIKKAFLIDACRGKEETKMVVVPRSSSCPTGASESRGGSLIDSVSVCEEADFLLAYSTLPMRKAYEVNGTGGIWLSTLAEFLKGRRYLFCLDYLLTEINREIVTMKNVLKSQQPDKYSRLNGHIDLDPNSTEEVRRKPSIKLAASFDSANSAAKPVPATSSARQPPVHSGTKTTNCRALLNEYCQKSGTARLKDEYIEDHSSGKPLFKCTLTCLLEGNKIVRDSGQRYHSRKDDAKEAAAAEILKAIKGKEKSHSRGAPVTGLATSMIWKSKLKEFFDKRGKPGTELKYKTTEAGDGNFISSIYIRDLGQEVKGEKARTKKEAEQNAAKKAVELLSSIL